MKNDPGLSGVFVNPKTGDIWQEGDVYTFPSLGKTLRAIATNGAKEFYEGDTAQKLVADVQVWKIMFNNFQFLPILCSRLLEELSLLMI